MIRRNVSKMFHQTLGRGITRLRERRASKKLPSGEREILVNEPVYISQIADAKKSSIEGFYGPIHDQKAAGRFGANLKEFSYWAWRSCGIVGLQMILLTELKKNFDKKTMELINEGLELGGYDVVTDTGWYHEALVKLAQKYGLEARLEKFISSLGIALELKKENFVLASIKSPTGGHLLLVYGVRFDKEGNLEGLIVHDPNNYKGPGEAKFIPRVEFEEVSTRRIISFRRIAHETRS